MFGLHVLGNAALKFSQGFGLDWRGLGCNCFGWRGLPRCWPCCGKKRPVQIGIAMPGGALNADAAAFVYPFKYRARRKPKLAAHGSWHRDLALRSEPGTAGGWGLDWHLQHTQRIRHYRGNAKR